MQAVLNNFKLLFYNGTLDVYDGIFVKFLIDNIWLILLALVSGGALAWPSLTRGKHSLSTLQAIQLLNKGKVSIVDVRKSDEFSAGHLRDSKNIPIDNLDKRVSELDKTHPVLVVCQSGVRASRAAGEFRRAGFGEVYILDGGYTEWRSQGLPVAIGI
ncbi:PspE Rhodanese-related sulfurtransferase [Oxalobacteraceae bacterium]